MPDLAVAEFGSDNVVVRRNVGDGIFAGPATLFRTGDGPSFVAIGDIDDDGNSEIAVANFRSDDVSILRSRCPPCCPADVTGPRGAPDRNVDSVDLMLLLSQWGSPCAGPCECDVTGPVPLVPDGSVDALDFLLITAQWGSPGSCAPAW